MRFVSTRWALSAAGLLSALALAACSSEPKPAPMMAPPPPPMVTVPPPPMMGTQSTRVVRHRYAKRKKMMARKRMMRRNKRWVRRHRR